MAAWRQQRAQVQHRRRARADKQALADFTVQSLCNAYVNLLEQRGKSDVRDARKPSTSSRTVAPVSRRQTPCLMPSTKSAGRKRAPLPRASDYACTFFKDWEWAHSERFDQQRLKEAWDGHRECHMGGAFCGSIGSTTPSPGLVVFVRSGTDADLFNRG